MLIGGKSRNVYLKFEGDNAGESIKDRTALVDPKVTAENMRRLHALGAETTMVEMPDETGTYLLTRLARIREMIAEDPGSLWTNQYSNAANPEAHYSGTAPEMFRQMEHRVDAVFVAVSTGGTLAGIGRYFRETSAEQERSSDTSIEHPAFAIPNGGTKVLSPDAALVRLAGLDLWALLFWRSLFGPPILLRIT